MTASRRPPPPVPGIGELGGVYGPEHVRELWQYVVDLYDGRAIPHGDTHAVDGTDPLQIPGLPSTIRPGVPPLIGNGPGHARSNHVHDFDGTAVLDNNARITVRQNSGANVGTRRRLNLIEGTGVILSVLDDTVDEEIDITINSTGGGGGGAPIDAQYLVAALHAGLSAERLITNTATLAWDAATAGQIKANVPDDSITYAKVQNVSAASRLLGRGSAAGAGDPEEITLGAGLAMTGTALSATVAAYTDEQAQDAVAAALSDTGRIQWFYNDTLNQIGADIWDHSITDVQLRFGAGTSVIGRAPAGSGSLADIAATADGQFLGRVAGALTWVVPPAAAPAPHAPTHSAAGSDPVTVTNLAGFPGGTATFLRADGTFAAPPDVDTGITQLTSDVAAGPGSGSQAATIQPNAVTYAKMQDVSTASRLLGRGDSGAGDPQEIILGTNLSMSGTTLNATGGGGSGITELTGDVTAGPGSGSQAATIANNAVTPAKLADFPGFSVLGKNTTGTGDPSAIIGAADSVLGRSGSGNLGFAVAGTDTVLGRIGSGNLGFGLLNTGQIAADAVTYAKLQNVSAASKLLGRGDSGAGDPEEITLGAGLAMSGTTLSSTGGGGGAPTGASYIVVALDATLTAERRLQGTANQVILTDGGANADMVLSTPQNIHTAAEPTFAGLTLTTEEWATQAGSPIAISAQQNNYNPGNGAFFRLASSAAWAITGILNGVDGRRMTLRNVGANDIRLAHEGTASTAANRIITPTGADILMKPDQTASLIYDATTQRWQVETPTTHKFFGAHHSDVTVATLARGDIAAYDGTNWYRLPIVAATNVLKSGSDPNWGKVVLTTDVSGNLPIGNGGTGANSAIAGFNALSPLTTLGDMLFRGATDNNRLAGNTTTTKKYLTQTGNGTISAIPVWDVLPTDAPVGSAYVTIGNDATLTGERALVGTADQIIVTDGGANANVTLSAPQNIGTTSSPSFAGLFLGAGWRITKEQVPATITGNLNDYDIGGGSYFVVQPNADGYTVSGFTNFSDGRRLRLYNATIYTWTLLHEGAGSTALNRITCPGGTNFPLGPKEMVDLIYSSTGRWLVAGTTSRVTPATTPTALTVSTNDYAIGDGIFFRLAFTSGSLSLRGIAGGRDGRRITIENVGSFDFLIAHDSSANAVTANRILCPKSKAFALKVGDTMEMIYDGTLSRWIVTYYTDPIAIDFVGNVFLNTPNAALATGATNGFIYLPSCAGVPTGVPATIITGSTPIVVDVTNKRLYAYIAGAWNQL